MWIEIFFVIFFIILPAKVYAQYNKIAGVVVDSITSEPIPFATLSGHRVSKFQLVSTSE